MFINLVNILTKQFSKLIYFLQVLLKTLNVKTPLIDADQLRMLACKALVGMARSETIRQIIGKLPPLNNGHLQSKYYICIIFYVTITLTD